MLKKWLKKHGGFSFLEILVSIVVVTTFGTAMLGTVMAGQDSTKRTDVTMFFDNRNLNATAVFKTNPSLDYVKTKEPFQDMNYNDSTKTFTQYFDKNLVSVPEGDSGAVYKSSYEVIIADNATNGFRFENKEIRLNMQNFKKNDVDDRYELVKNSSAQGSISVHANVLEEGKVIPSTAPTDPTGPTHPGDPGEPENPGDPGDPDDPTKPVTEYRYVEFVLSEGTFTDTESNTLTKRVKKGSRFGDSIQVDESVSKPILPVEHVDFGPNPGVAPVFSGWKNADGTSVSTNQVINSNLTIIGDYTEPNLDINIEVSLTDRNFWDTSSAALGFTADGDQTYVTVQESALNGIPAHDGSLRRYAISGSTSELKSKIKNVNAVLPFNLRITYQYVDVKKAMSDHPALQLSYNSAVLSGAGNFDGSGAKFGVTDATKTQLAGILGMDPSLIALNVSYVKSPVDVSVIAKPGLAANFGLELKLRDVGNDGRSADEKYQIKLVKQAGRKDKWGNDYTPYEVQIIGNNGQNIMNSNKEGGRAWGETIHLSNLNLNVGGANGLELSEIHELTFLTTGFNPQFHEGEALNAIGTDLKVHSIRSYPGNGNESTVPTIGGGSEGKGWLQMYGSEDGSGNATSFGWLSGNKQWRMADGWHDINMGAYLVNDCPNTSSATINLPLPNGFTAALK